MAPRKRKAESLAPVAQPTASDAEEEDAPMSCETPEELEDQVKRVSETNTVAEVKRLYKMRNALKSINWLSQEGRSLKDQLVLLILNKIMYKAVEGHAIIGQVLILHASCMGEAFGVFKQFIAETSTPAVLDGAGLALRRAWRASGGAERLQLEESLRNLMKLAVTASFEAAERIRRVLSKLRERQENDPELAGTFTRLYGPVLWRYFKVANWQVRWNAISVLSAMFPLVTPGAAVSVAEAELSKQLLMLQEAVTDVDEGVRRMAVLAVSTVLLRHCSTISNEWIARLLTTISEKAAFDIAPLVRSQTLDSIRNIVALNGLIRPAVAAVLPKLRLCLHDPKPAVRLAFIKLVDQSRKALISYPLHEMFTQEDLFKRLVFERQLLMGGVKTQLNVRVCEAIANSMAAGVFEQPLESQIKYVDEYLNVSVIGTVTLLKFLKGPDYKLIKAKLCYGLLDKVAASPDRDLPLQRGRLLAVSEMLESLKLVLIDPKGEEDKKISTWFYQQISSSFFIRMLGLELDSEVLDCLVHLRFDNPLRFFEDLVGEVDASLPVLYLLADAWGLMDKYLDTQLAGFKQFTAKGASSFASAKNAEALENIVDTLQGVLEIDRDEYAERIASVTQTVVPKLIPSLGTINPLGRRVLELCLNATVLGGSKNSQIFSSVFNTLNNLPENAASLLASILEVGFCALARSTTSDFQHSVPAVYDRVARAVPEERVDVSNAMELLAFMAEIPEIEETVILACLASFLDHVPGEAVSGQISKNAVAKLATRLGRVEEFQNLVTSSHPLAEQLKAKSHPSTHNSFMELTAVRLNNGVEMPVFGLGTWQAEPTLTAAAVREALSAGYRQVDAAWIYMNQKEVGEGIRDSGIAREGIFLVSKLWMVHFHPDKVRGAVEKILADLGVDYLDQLLLHWPMAWHTKDETSENWYLPKDELGHFTVDESVDLKDTWRELEKLYSEGKLRSIGVSNFSVSELQYILDNAQVKPQVNQVELHVRLPQTELRAFCKQHDIQIVGYAPLGSPGAMGVKSLLEDPVVASIAEKHNSTSAAALIRWSLQKGNVVIPKSTTSSRIRGNMGCFDFFLDSDDLVALDELSNTNPQRIFNPPFRPQGRKVFDI